ncbi:MAG: DUF3320 domain-containing protein, partial [Victivallales bacterium]|nr:DUF3320 domain-containing protein [Victivallales bacterium]
ESILDECLAAGLESSYLNWHYRSRHEALISFSNHYYYGDRLFTFPSAQQSGRLGVGFRFVPGGIYGKSNTRTNPNEARALVEYIFDKLEKSQDRKRSIGVVTFSEAQKNLIEDMVEDERRKHPGLEAYFSDQNEEPLFVKNLENVQGDERDVILFSICYAPDANGNFSMNFGPLNRQGGERRLNVAITRAKEQVLVFSSIHASDIDLSRTNALGAAHLKYFLDYAEKGFRIQAGNATEMADSSLSRVIEDFLKEKGFSVEHKVGCSGYRIDLAVRNPDNEKEYLLGIECDGPSYASQRTTRDREHLRPSVLRSLGWHIWRAWTVDWVLDRRHAQEELLHQIELARTMPLSAPAEVEEPEMAEEDIPAAAIETRTEKPVVYYQVASIKCGRQPEMFYDISSQAIIKKQIKEVIQQEAPIYEHLLKKRIANAWRVNLIAKTQAVLDACIPDNLLTTQVSGEIVYWSEKQNPAEYRVFRANPQEKCREIDDIPPEELANAMLDILINFGSCEPDALYRETLKVFGLGKVTQKARKYLDFGLQVLKQNNMI